MQEVWPNPQNDIEYNERLLQQTAQRGADINEVEFIRAIRDHPPEPAEIDRTAMEKAQQNGCANLENWRAGQRLDESTPIVLFDNKHRLAAIGWPHSNLTYLFERMKHDRVILHRQGQCILKEGMWHLMQILVSINNDDGWGAQPGASVTGMFQTVHHMSEEIERQTSASR